MSRFYVPKENVKGSQIYIDGQEARHILNVMRLKANDSVLVFDGTGREYAGFIKDAKAKSLTVEIISTKHPKKDTLPEITLAQAMPKKDKMETIVEKAAELGVSAIVPLVTERTIAWAEAGKAIEKVNRWKKLAVEAAKQCGRPDIPEIKNIQKFYDFIYNINDFDLALMACFSEVVTSFKDAISDFEGGKIIVFIGPEGDFTPDEIEMARGANCKFISLGQRVLKSDTAGLYVLSVLNHVFS